MEAANVGAWQYFAVVPDMRVTGVRDGNALLIADAQRIYRRMRRGQDLKAQCFDRASVHAFKAQNAFGSIALFARIAWHFDIHGT